MEQSKHSQVKVQEEAKPYQLRDKGNNVHTFLTVHGIEYGIRFKAGPIPPDLEDKGLEILEFEFLTADEKPKHDDRVSATVVKALKDYFVDSKRVAVYVCDEQGEKRRGQYRQQLFSAWHQRMGEGYGIFQFEPVIETDEGEYELYAGIIYREDCPDKDLLVEKIPAIAADYIIRKYFE